MNIAIIYSTTTEIARKSSVAQTDDDTKVVAHAVSKALRSLGHRTTLHPLTPRNIDTILNIHADCVFNLVEWTGRDMYLILPVYKNIRLLNIPYTGSTFENYMNMSDKTNMKRIFKKMHIPTPAWQLFWGPHARLSTKFNYPVIVKAAREHCSIGLSADSLAFSVEELRIKIKKNLFTHKQPILVENFIKGREFQVTIIEKNSKPVMLPVEEVLFTSSSPTPFLTYASKWIKGSADFEGTNISLTPLGAGLKKLLNHITTHTFTVLGFRGYARFDIRVRGNDVYILEANANPNLFDPDEVGQEVSYTAAGMTFAQYLWCIVEAAFYHHRGK